MNKICAALALSGLLLCARVSGVEADPENIGAEVEAALESAERRSESADEALSKLEFDVPSVSEENESEENSKVAEYQLKKAKRKLLIIKLKDASSIIEDISHDMQVVLFVENDKDSLEANAETEGRYRKALIDSLKAARDEPDVRETTFYFTDCAFLQNLCQEMSIDPEKNQVAHVSKYIATPMDMRSADLVERVWERMAQSLERMESIDELNREVEASGVNVVLFNPAPQDDPVERARQTERMLKLVRRCKKNCFERYLFVQLEKRDEFLERKENLGKTFLIRQGRFTETPFRLSKGNAQTEKTLTMMNNEGSEAVLENNNENYFKIYQNDMKAIVTLVLNTEDEARREMLLRSFKEAGRLHRAHRKDFLDRYTFVITDLPRSEPEYRELLLEVTGELKVDAEVYIFSRGNHMDSYENFSLKENLDAVQNFLGSLEERIAEYEDTAEKKKQLMKEAKESGRELELDPKDAEILDYGELYLDTWKELKDMPEPAVNQDEDLTVRNILGLLYANDMEKLEQLFYKSEDEDREHNDRHLRSGLLQVTGKNFDRVIFGSGEPQPEMEHNFILAVCKNTSEEEAQGCARLGEMLHFLRENFPREDAEIRVGLMDALRNDHRVIERFNIESYPVLIFFGKTDAKRRGKIFRGKLVVEKVLRWLDRKFLDNEGTALDLTDEHYKELLLITADGEE